MNEHLSFQYQMMNQRTRMIYQQFCYYCISVPCFSCLTTWFITWSNQKFRTFSPCTVHAPHDGTAAHSTEARLGNEATALDAIPALGVPGAAQPTMVQRIVMEKMRIQQCWMYGNINDNDCHGILCYFPTDVRIINNSYDTLVIMWDVRKSNQLSLEKIRI